MKKVIELLKEAVETLQSVNARDLKPADSTFFLYGRDFVKKALDALQAPPRWETPEQYKERTGEDWPEEGAVYFRCIHIEPGWGVCRYISAKRDCDFCVCATEAGPPPEDWKPEENSK